MNASEEQLRSQLGTKTPPEGMLNYVVHEHSPEAAWMVFIHGAGGSLATWKYQVKGFQSHYNLLLVDMRDHGRSKDIEPAYDRYDFDIITSDIIRVIEFLDIKKAHFLSLSLGSIILQELHGQRPDMMLSMIMAGGVFKADWKIHFFAHSGKFFSYFVPFQWIYDLFSLIVMPRKNHQPSRQLFRQQSQKLTPKEFLKWLGLYRHFFRVVKRFYHKKLETVSLIVAGGQDHVFLEAAKRYALKQAHLAKLVIIENCGHVCNVEQANRFNNEVLAFLANLDHSRPTLG